MGRELPGLHEPELTVRFDLIAATCVAMLASCRARASHAAIAAWAGPAERFTAAGELLATGAAAGGAADGAELAATAAAIWSEVVAPGAGRAAGISVLSATSITASSAGAAAGAITPTAVSRVVLMIGSMVRKASWTAEARRARWRRLMVWFACFTKCWDQ